jgi:alginate production protein
VGRQDFDDPREWVYDQNLDAVRTVWNHESVRLELSASTNLTNGTEFDRHSNNYIAYLSNNNRKKHLGAYIVDRRDARVPRSYPIHFGVRALGDWIPQSESWLEYSVLRGYTEDMNLESWAFDVGSTWSPPSLEPFYLSAGFAYSTGDDPSTPEVNEGFQQTGFQDNNGRLGGVTSFRYYGELVDPELSNLGILTLGLGMRPTRDSSLDLVYHDYRLSELTTKMRDTQLKNQPNGVGQGYGEELDLILGVRRLQGFDIKFVLGYFRPGDAFTGGDDAFLASFRLRYRF